MPDIDPNQTEKDFRRAVGKSSPPDSDIEFNFKDKGAGKKLIRKPVPDKDKEVFRLED